MAGGGWIISARYLFSGNAISYVENLSRAQSMADVTTARLTGKINAQEAAFLRNRIAADRAAMAHRNLVATTIAGGIAIGGALGIGYALDQAGKLQQKLLSIKNETGASSGQLANIGTDIFNIANRNGMSVNDAAEIWRTTSRLTAGQMSIAQMRAIAPLVAQFASVVNFNRPDVSVDQAARVGLSTSHLFRAYDQKHLAPLLDKVYRLSGLMTESPDQALRQMSYYVPLFKGLRIKDDQSIAMMALLDRAGFRNKVGTNVRAMLLEALGPLQQTTHAQAGKAAMLEQMGIFKNGKFAFTQKDGSVDFLGVLRQVSQWEHVQHNKGETLADLTKTLYSVFGRQGGTIASLMADPRMVRFLDSIAKYLHDPNVGLAAGTRNRNEGLNFEFMRAANNLQAVLVDLGSPWMKDLSGFFSGIADRAHDFQGFLHGHRDFEKGLGAIAGVLTTAAGVVAGVGVVSRALVFIGVLKSMPNVLGLVGGGLRGVATGLWAVSGAATPMPATLGAAAAAFRAFAGAILANPLIKLGLMMLPLLTTSGGVSEDEARGKLVKMYGKSYANYLGKRRKGAYYFDPSAGDLTPDEFYHGVKTKAARQQERPIHLEVKFYAPVTHKDGAFIGARITQAVRQAVKHDPMAGAILGTP